MFVTNAFWTYTSASDALKKELIDANKKIAPTEFVVQKFAANTNATLAKSISQQKQKKWCVLIVRSPSVLKVAFKVLTQLSLRK